MATADDVRRIALALPETQQSEEGPARADPEFFTTAHHNGYPAVLVRLAAVDVDELAELLTDGWRCQAPKPLVKEFENLPSR